MVLRNGHFELLYPFAILDGTDQKILPSAQGLIDQDGNQSFYDGHQHHGRLVCPECQVARLGWRKGKARKGDDDRARDHFFLLPKSDHALSCQIGQLGLSYPAGNRRIDARKGGYVYMNIETMAPTAPFAKSFRRRSVLPEEFARTKPDWIKRIETMEGWRGFPEIATPDFVDRVRLRAVKDVSGLLKILQLTPREKMRDTYVIRNKVAVRLDQMILREGTSGVREVVEMDGVKSAYGLSRSFLMAVDKAYDRYAKLLDTQRQGVRIPMLMHFNIAAHPYKVSKGHHDQPEMVINIKGYDVENPERLKPKWNSLALPTVHVARRLCVQAPELFDVMRGGGEFFAIVHPFMVRRDQLNAQYIQGFDIMRGCDVIGLSMADLAKKIRVIEGERAAKAANHNGSPTAPAMKQPA